MGVPIVIMDGEIGNYVYFAETSEIRLKKEHEENARGTGVKIVRLKDDVQEIGFDLVRHLLDGIIRRKGQGNGSEKGKS